MQRVAELSKEHALRAHSEAIAFVIMACVLIVAPVFAYPVFLMPPDSARSSARSRFAGKASILP